MHIEYARHISIAFTHVLLTITFSQKQATCLHLAFAKQKHGNNVKSSVPALPLQ